MNNKEFLSQSLARKIFQTLNINPSEKFLKVLSKVAQVFRFIFSPIYALVFLMFGTPFDSPKVKDIKEISVDEPKMGFIDKIKCYLTGDCFKFCSAWKVMNWQDRVVEQYGSNTITSDQARQVSCPDYLSLKK